MKQVASSAVLGVVLRGAILISLFGGGCVGGIDEGPSLDLGNYETIVRDDPTGPGGVLEFVTDPDDPGTDLGSIFVSSANALTLTVRNTGPGSVTLGSLSSLGTGFAATGGTCAASKKLEVDASCTLTMRYVASAAGAVSTQFSLPYLSGRSQKTLSTTVTATAALAPLSGSAVSSSEISIVWSSITGSEVVLVVHEGSTAPTSCSGGITITNSSPYSLTGLSPNTSYSYVICGKDSGTPIVATAGVTTSTSSNTQASPFQLVGNPSASGSDTFGFSVAVSGAKALIGNPIPVRGMQNAGQVLAFKLNGSGVWVYTQTLTGTRVNNSNEDSFGSAVAMKGDEAVIGAPERENFSGNFTNSGAAFYFKYNSGTSQWVETKVFTASAVDETFNQGAYFGGSVAIDSGVIAVGSPRLSTTNGSHVQIEQRHGAVYVYQGSNTTWTETRIIPSDHADSDQFGTSVALSGGELFASALHGTATNTDVGSVYIFSQSGNWSQTAELGPPASGSNTSFGKSIAANGAILAVGDPGYGSDVGRVFIFRKPASTWTYSHAVSESASLSAMSGGNQFGAAVALSGNNLIVGAPYANSKSGAVYLFQSSGVADFTKTTRFLPTSRADGYIGSSVGFSGNTMVIGGDLYDQGFMTSGDGRAFFLDDSYREPI